jgi:hypothetical protein
VRQHRLLCADRRRPRSPCTPRITHQIKYTSRGFRAQERRWWGWKNVGPPRATLGQAIEDLQPFDGPDRGDNHQRETALAILQDVQTYLSTPGRWLRGGGKWSADHGQRHCLIGAVEFFGRRRKVRLTDNLARGYLCQALRQRHADTATPETFNDEVCRDLPEVLDLVAAAIEIVRADLDEAAALSPISSLSSD